MSRPFNSTILTKENAIEIGERLGLPNPQSQIQAVRRGMDIYQRGLVSFDHATQDGQQWYNVKSQGIWEETHKNIYSVAKGSVAICTCPEGRRIQRQTIGPSIVDECKHGIAVELSLLFPPEPVWYDSRLEEDPDRRAWLVWRETA